MITVTIPSIEIYDPEREEFVNIKGATLRMEHSLISISKWESKWKKPFLVEKPPKTLEESIDYYECMCLDKNVDPNIFKYGFIQNRDVVNRINEYMKDPMTATWFSDKEKKQNAPFRSNVVTSELIYWSMIDNNIPIEFEKWNINRLLTLIRVCNTKREEAAAQMNGKHGKKSSLNSLYKQHNAINEANKAKFNAKR